MGNRRLTLYKGWVNAKTVGNEELWTHAPAKSRNRSWTSFHPYRRSLAVPQYWTLTGAARAPAAVPRSHAAVPRRARFICTAWEPIPTPALKSAALCTAAEAAPTTGIPASRRSSWDLEIIFPAQTHSRLQEEFANMICLILSTRIPFRGVREEDKSLSKPLSFLVGLLISEGYLKLYQPTQKSWV